MILQISLSCRRKTNSFVNSKILTDEIAIISQTAGLLQIQSETAAKQSDRRPTISSNQFPTSYQFDIHWLFPSTTNNISSPQEVLYLMVKETRFNLCFDSDQRIFWNLMAFYCGNLLTFFSGNYGNKQSFLLWKFTSSVDTLVIKKNQYA